MTSSQRRRGLFAGIAVVLGLALADVASAAMTPQTITQGEAITETFTIMAIDFKGRLVTLKDKDGFTETIIAGPDVQRFDALKVGDKVTFRYYESVISQILKPGTTTPATSDKTEIARVEGTRPGGTISRQMTATVTVEALDLKLSSVTIRTDDGSRSSFKVQNPKNLEGVKVGDRVQITYTMARAISVQSPGK